METITAKQYFEDNDGRTLLVGGCGDYDVVTSEVYEIMEAYAKKKVVAVLDKLSSDIKSDLDKGNFALGVRTEIEYILEGIKLLKEGEV